MKTTVVNDVARWVGDDTLMARLDKTSRPLSSGGANLRIGIEGPQGKIYRVIETDSIVEAVRVFETLREMGLGIEAGHRRADGTQLNRVFRKQE